MVKLKQKGMKWLRLLHIITASIWFGGVVCIGVLAYICFFQLTESEFLTVVPWVPGLYQKLVLPFAVLTLLEGLIYGLFTNWGFAKHKWILCKWVLAILVALCTGLGGIGQIFSVINKVETTGFSGGFADGGLALLFIHLQIIFMVVMIALSVFKPMKRKQKAEI
jgi:hypothetical protein